MLVGRWIKSETPAPCNSSFRGSESGHQEGTLRLSTVSLASLAGCSESSVGLHGAATTISQARQTGEVLYSRILQWCWYYLLDQLCPTQSTTQSHADRRVQVLSKISFTGMHRDPTKGNCAKPAPA